MVESRYVRVNDVRLHYRIAGDGPAVVLLHGWPQTNHTWRHIIEPLANTGRTVIAPDLRGYGLSDKPLFGYDKRTMASDIRELTRQLGFDSVVLIGHDRGARVAHRYALDHPGEVSHLAVLDIIPTREMWRHFDMKSRVAADTWHWTFHLQPDLPELLAGANVRGYLEFFFERWTVRRDALDAAAVDEYVRAFSRPGALRAGFDDYRASFPTDAADDDADFDAGRLLTIPVLALWGSAGLPSKLDVATIWSSYAADLRSAAIADCGHFIPEEQPDELLRQLTTFLTDSSDATT